MGNKKGFYFIIKKRRRKKGRNKIKGRCPLER